MTQNPPQGTLAKRKNSKKERARRLAFFARESSALFDPNYLLCRGLERIPQRELNQTRLAVGADDFAERRVGYPRGFDVGDRGIGEVRMIPNVKEVGGEAEVLPLFHMDVLDQREVPILLKGPAVGITLQI